MTTEEVNVTQEEFLQELVADLQRENSILKQSLLIAQIRNRKLSEKLGVEGPDVPEPMVEEEVSEDE